MINRILVILIMIIQFPGLASSEQVKPDSYYTSVRHEYILKDNGDIIYNYEHGLKLLTYFAVNRLHGETFITYNPDWQTLEVIKSNTLMANGKLVESPVNAFNEVLPGDVSHAVPYMNLRELVVTHTGLERESEINLAYTLTTKKGFYPGMIGKIILGKHEPVKEFEIIIKVPKGKKLNLYMSNDGPIGDKFTQDEFDVYYWKINNLPLIPGESNQPELEEFMPTLYFSTAGNSKVVSHILSDNELFVLPERVKTLTDTLLSNKFSDMERLLALRDYVYSNIGRTPVSLIHTGFKPMKASETFTRNVGTSVDRAVLLTAMCKSAGLNADIAVVANFSNAKPDISFLSEYENFLVYCKPDNENEIPILLDPNSPQNHIIPSSVANKTVFVLNPEKLYIIPALKESGTLSFAGNFKVHKDSLEGNVKLSLSGHYLPDMKIEECKKSVINFFNNTSWNISDSDLSGLIGTDNKFDITLNIKNYKIKFLDDIMMINLPEAPQSFYFDNINLIPETRVTPVKLPTMYHEDYYFVFDIPDNIQIINKPDDINIENSAGELNCSVVEEGKRIRVRRHLKINKYLILPEEYHHLYKLISLWNNKKYKNIYLK
jgi:hypothetical protein